MNSAVFHTLSKFCKVKSKMDVSIIIDGHEDSWLYKKYPALVWKKTIIFLQLANLTRIKPSDNLTE